METLDASYWNNRYKSKNDGWDTGAVTTPLKTYIDQLTDKNISILIPGAGNAYEAEYLLQQGFSNVYVCDFAPEPIRSFMERVPLFPGKNILMADFFELADINFQLILEQTFFCAIAPALRKRYFAQMHRLLKPRGHLVGLLFDTTFEHEGPPFGGTKNEYLEYFSSTFAIKTFETAYNSIAPRAGRELFMNLQKTA